MHNNYHLLSRLAPELNELLTDSILVECFSQESDQLILGFDRGGEDFYIKADLKPGFSTLSFPSNFARAKQSTRNFFQEINDAKVVSVTTPEYERCLIFQFENGYRLIFKLFGDRSNILTANHSEVLKIFKKKLFNDLELNPNAFDKDVSLDYDTFSLENIHEQMPTLGKIVNAFLKEKEAELTSKEEQWQFLLGLLQEMQEGKIYLTEINDKYALSLVPYGKVLETFDSVIKALNAFTKKRGYQFYLETDKKQISLQLHAGIKKAEKYIKEADSKLASMQEGPSFKELADIIMANLHAIPEGAEKAQLFNFYTNEDIDVKLDKKLKPQTIAEKYYRKAKNRNIEVNTLLENIKSKKEQLTLFKADLQTLEESEDIRSLRKDLGNYLPHTKAAKAIENTPRFKEYFLNGFKILVGRNAKNNDELTLHEAKKDDYWLHAKDVSGSHVVIKHQAGKNVPKDVKEYAASLAAFYSKRKTDSLCPVIFTQKKYVRKIKGAAAGSVRVEKEDVILIEPARL